MNPRLALFVTAALATTTLAGCSAGTAAVSGRAAPADGRPVAAADRLPYGGAPAVSNPLPAELFTGDFLRDPCAFLLSADDVRSTVGAPVRSGPADEADIGSGCDWYNTQNGAQLTVQYDSVLRDGLSLVYQNTRPKAWRWTERPIAGFPVVGYVSTGRKGDPTFCHTSAGVRNETTLDMSVTLSDDKTGKVDPCEAAFGINDLVLNRLRAKVG